MYRDAWKKILAVVVTICLMVVMVQLPGSSLRAKDAKTYHTYQYGGSESAGLIGEKKTAAVFMTGQNTNGDEEILQSVSFDVYTAGDINADARALVELYTSPNPGDPASGVLAASKEIVGLNEGTNLVSFEELSLKLVRGECFSAVITIEGEEIAFYTDEFDEEQRTFAAAEDGSWSDLYESGKCAVVRVVTSDQEEKGGVFRRISAWMGQTEVTDETETPSETEINEIENFTQAAELSGGEGTDYGQIEDDTILNDSESRADVTNINDAEIVLPGGLNYRYTGAAIRPEVVITINGRELYQNADYSVSYDNNIEVGTGTISIAGINAFTGSATIEFYILPYNVSLETDVSVQPIGDVGFTGSPVFPPVTMTYRTPTGTEITLRQDTDYTITYENNLNVGIAVAKVHGMGQFAGSRAINFNIVPYSLESENVVIAEIPEQAYTGSAVIPNFSIHYGNYELLQGRDYTVACTNNTEIGTATAVLQGQNNFVGNRAVQFSIVSNSMQDAQVDGIEETYPYTGKAIKPKDFIVKIGSKILTEGIDYTVTYGENTQIGSGTVVIKGMGFYLDNEKEVTFRITRKDLGDDDIEIEGFQDSFLYTGEAIVQNISVHYGDVTLIPQTDYTVQYLRNTSIGTASMILTGTGNYTGSVQKEYAIYLVSAIDSEVEIGNMSSVYVYNGEAVVPQPVLTRRGADLKEGVDYDLEFENNIDAGIATMRIVGRDNCPGVREETFMIFKRSIHLADVSGIGLQIYTGRDIEPTITASDSGKALTAGVDYALNYRLNREPGTAVAVLKGIGNYTAAREIRFEIRPGDVDSIAVSATTTSSATISWSSGGASTGYEIFRAGPDGQYQRIARKVGTTFTDTQLTAGQLYYYKVRAYYVTEADTYYGNFSPVTRAIAR